jgi:hypothetical protein
MEISQFLAVSLINWLVHRNAKIILWLNLKIIIRCARYSDRVIVLLGECEWLLLLLLRVLLKQLFIQDRFI